MLNINLMYDVLTSIIPIIGMIILYHFLLWLPQTNAKQNHTELLANIKPGDVVLTKSGIIGYVVEKNENTLIIKSCNTHLKISNKYVAEKLPA